MLKLALEKIAQIGRRVDGEARLDADQREKLAHLRDHGYVMFDHLVEMPEFAKIQEDLKDRIEQKLEFDVPCLAQNKIDPEHHKALIENNFLGTIQEYKDLGLTFDRSDIMSYSQAIDEFSPSTLKINLPDSDSFRSLWLDPKILSIVEAYMGFSPILVEAYIRRNFPAKHRVMNHFWHRDTNHSRHLLKMFIFFSDCTEKTGPHHYISNSIDDPELSGRPYYSDEEIRNLYPETSGREIVSVVKAGTIVLEDTRGLHKAGVPDEHYRDLGFAVFLPPIAFRPPPTLYDIPRSAYDMLSEQQQLFIPKGNVRD